VNLHLHPADWAVLMAVFAIPVVIGYRLRHRGAKDSGSFLLSGRSLPWWLAGTSMAADTFASDTPLYVAKVVRTTGIAGNWQWWCFAISGLLSVFLLAPLWRRTEAVTDVEFVEIRYGGRPAAFLRGFKAFLLAVPFNCILVGGMPLLAMAKILVTLGGADGTLDGPEAASAAATAKAVAIGASLGVVLLYATVSGLWAVVWNDFFFIWVAFAGAVTLAAYAVAEVGGLGALRDGILAADGGSTWRLDLLPSPGEVLPGTGQAAGLALGAFLVFTGVQWWAHRTADGGGVFAQRMLACRSEGHAVGATLWFNILNYTIRTWPWVLCGLAAILLYPDLSAQGADPELGYPRLIRDLLPAGIRGLVLASLFAAFMSTADTQLHWGAGYLVNDVYRRFIAPEASEARTVLASRIAVLLLALVTAVVAFYATSVEAVFSFLLRFFAGTGTVFLARWLWWRVNAWGEIAAMAAAPVGSLYFELLTAPPGAPAASGGVAGTFDTLLDALGRGALHGLPGWWGIPFVAGVTTASWLTATLLTAPVPMDRLTAFYRKTRPPGFWGPVRAAAPDAPTADAVGRDLVRWGLGLVLVLGSMAGSGKLLLGEPGEGAFLLGASLLCGGLLYLTYRR
jgi:SSS family solute:Na+ symporter